MGREIENIVNPLLEPITKQGMSDKFAEEISDKINSLLRTRGSCLISGGYEQIFNKSILDCEIYSLRSFKTFPEAISGALESLNLIKREKFVYNQYVNWSVWSDYHVLTIFGMEFFYTGYSGSNIIEDEVASS